MSIKDVMKFLKHTGRYDSYLAMARAAGIEERRLQNVMKRGVALSATEEIRLAQACNMDPLRVMAMIESAANPENEQTWKRLVPDFRWLLNALSGGVGLAR